MSSLRLLRSGIPIGTSIGMAALGFVVADHGFASIALALWCIATIVFVVGVVAAVIDARAESQRIRVEVEERRRDAIVKQLQQEYRRSHPTEALAIIAGMARIPKAWMDDQLEKMGETWRRDVYR